jgi:hypothetical protein
MLDHRTRNRIDIARKAGRVDLGRTMKTAENWRLRLLATICSAGAGPACAGARRARSGSSVVPSAGTGACLCE